MEQTIVGKEQNRKTSEDGRTENAAPIRKEAEQTAGAVRWTPEQRKVIDLRGRSMLVSAAGRLRKKQPCWWSASSPW